MGTNITRDHFVYEEYMEIPDDPDTEEKKRPRTWKISMKEFYNFILQERGGSLKSNHKGPQHDLHEYKSFRNKKKKVAQRQNLPTDNAMWNTKVNWDGYVWTIKPQQTSRVIMLQRLDENGKSISIPFPKELRQKEKKNPILYGGRLKLFYLCDQGVKIENNDLRWHERKESQKKYCSVSFKQSMDHAVTGEPMNEVGKKRILPSSFTHGKRCYSQRYYDAMAVVLARQRPDLFITVTGSTLCAEMERLRDKRPTQEMICIANRIFAIKLKSFMQDIVKKQIFGRIVGEIWIIEYQKRGIPHAHICLCLDARDKLRHGTNFQRTNDFVDQMIWAEVPVAAEDDKRPDGWRHADAHRQDRWCCDEIIDPSDATNDDEEEELEKIEERMMEFHNNNERTFVIQHSGCTQESTQSMQIDSLEEDSMRSVTESKVKSHDKVLDSDDEKQSFVPLSQDSDFLSAEEDGENGTETQDSDFSDEEHDAGNGMENSSQWKGCMQDPEDFEFSEDEDIEDPIDPNDETMEDILDEFLQDNDNSQPKQWWKKKPWNQSLSEFVVSRMAHDPCGSHVPGGRYCRCMKKGKCKAKMPRDIREDTDGTVDGYAAYRRREYLLEEDNMMPTKRKFVSRWTKGGKRAKNGIQCDIDGRWIPGYNPAVLMKYRLHINVEYCGSIKAINYLYKYIYLHILFKNSIHLCVGTKEQIKHISMVFMYYLTKKIQRKSLMSLKQYKEEEDEIKLHKYGRILTANECHYRIAGFKQHHLYPSVTRLKFFVPEKKRIVVEEGSVVTEEFVMQQLEDSEYFRWMKRNQYEYDIWQEFESIVATGTYDKLDLMMKMKRKLGYSMFCMDRKDGEDVLCRMKDVIMGNPEEDLPFAFEMTYEEFGKRYQNFS